MAAWDTILKLRQDVDDCHKLISLLYEKLQEDPCTCNLSCAKQLLALIQTEMAGAKQDDMSVRSHNYEAYELLSLGLSSSTSRKKGRNDR